MPLLSLTFNIEEPPHNGSCFLLIAKESDNSNFSFPIQLTATAFHRILYKLDKIALASVITIECNSLLVSFFNISSKKAKQLCETAITMLHSMTTFTIQENEFRFDKYMLKAAYEALITRTLEELGWWLLNDSGSIILFHQKGIEIANFKINTGTSLQHASRLFQKPNNDEKITINISGKTTYKQYPIFKIPNKLQKIYKDKGYLDLDYIPCKVLPKFKNAFVVKIINISNIDMNLSKKIISPIPNAESESPETMTHKSEFIFPSSKEIQEIKDYWLYTHGILIQQVSAILKVSFAKGGKSLTYPIECVIDQNPYDNFGLKLNKIHFEDKLKDYISETIGIVAFNQKVKS